MRTLLLHRWEIQKHIPFLALVTIFIFSCQKHETPFNHQTVAQKMNGTRIWHGTGQSFCTLCTPPSLTYDVTDTISIAMASDTAQMSFKSGYYISIPYLSHDEKSKILNFYTDSPPFGHASIKYYYASDIIEFEYESGGYGYSEVENLSTH